MQSLIDAVILSVSRFHMKDGRKTWFIRLFGFTLIGQKIPADSWTTGTLTIFTLYNIVRTESIAPTVGPDGYPATITVYPLLRCILGDYDTALKKVRVPGTERIVRHTAGDFTIVELKRYSGYKNLSKLGIYLSKPVRSWQVTSSNPDVSIWEHSFSPPDWKDIEPTNNQIINTAFEIAALANGARPS